MNKFCTKHSSGSGSQQTDVVNSVNLQCSAVQCPNTWVEPSKQFQLLQLTDWPWAW